MQNPGLDTSTYKPLIATTASFQIRSGLYIYYLSTFAQASLNTYPIYFPVLISTMHLLNNISYHCITKRYNEFLIPMQTIPVSNTHFIIAHGAGRFEKNYCLSL